MSVQLLDKTRKINKLLHNNSSSKVVFNDICDVLTGVLESDILVISKKGKVLGSSVCNGVDEIKELIVDEVGGYIDPALNERLLGILSTKENVNLETLGFGEESKRYQAIITPIDIAGERLGTLFAYRQKTPRPWHSRLYRACDRITYRNRQDLRTGVPQNPYPCIQESFRYRPRCRMYMYTRSGLFRRICRGSFLFL